MDSLHVTDASASAVAGTADPSIVFRGASQTAFRSVAPLAALAGCRPRRRRLSAGCLRARAPRRRDRRRTAACQPAVAVSRGACEDPSLGRAFDRGRDGPGGWWIFHEPELHFGEDVLVPDVTDWRRGRMPKLPETDYVILAPDWACEVFSPATRRLRPRRQAPGLRLGGRRAPVAGRPRAKFCSAALPGKSMSYAISSRSAELEW